MILLLWNMFVLVDYYEVLVFYFKTFLRFAEQKL